MGISVTTLSENTASWLGLLGEWGLSLLVDVDGTRVLLDTGATDTAVHNAAALGIDLSTVDKIVLSHGHYDHTGGLRPVLRAMKKPVEVIAHPDMWTSKYARLSEEESYRYIGIPFQREALEGLGASFTLSREPVRITDRIVTTGEVPMRNDYEQIDPILYVRERGEFKPDPLADDMSLVVKSDEGLVVLAGCAHRGIINTLHRAREVTGVNRIKAVIGGTHLRSAGEERMQFTVAALREFEVQKLGTSHCTGFHSAATLAREFGDGFLVNNAGISLTL
jgi:7,8-dihydropterin-6-yl-methyl-4-(beta-D-ribofuranosyl)aminobenzene 5'-phosphate synthase